jgi:hypothetical protein
MHKFLEVPPIYLLFFCHRVCSSNLRTSQITVCANLKIQISEDDDDDDEEFMQLPYPTLPTTRHLLLHHDTSVGWFTRTEKVGTN